MSNSTDERHPFTTPPDSDAEMFIQWKNTDVCLDFTCPCGEGGHYDGASAYALRCGGCGTVYEMGTQVVAKRASDFGGTIRDLDMDES